MKIVFQINGDINKNIAATAVCKAIKTEYPECPLIVFTGFPQVFAGNPNIARVHTFGDTDEFIRYKNGPGDTLFFLHDPCKETDYINKSKEIIQVWCEMYHIPYNGERPELFFTDDDKDAFKSKFGYANNTKQVMIDQGIIKNINHRISRQ